MTLLDVASDRTDQADLAIMAVVETVRDQMQPVTPATICAMIGGAPYDEVARRLARLAELGCLEVEPGKVSLYWVSALGAELLARDLIGWSPSVREQARRDLMLRSSTIGRLRY